MSARTTRSCSSSPEARAARSWAPCVATCPTSRSHFTVVTWDQRGAGTSYDELDPTATVTLDGYVADTIAVTNYLRDRFGQDDIYLLGQSWGTTLGVLAVQEQPELYRAFIGTGQMVSQRATDRIFYEDTLAWAARTGRDDLADRARRMPARRPTRRCSRYETALSHEQDVYPYDHSGNSEGAGQMSENLLVEEYALIDQVHVLGAFMDTFAALYPQLQEIDFRTSATDFAVPMFFVQGAHEARGRAEPFARVVPDDRCSDQGPRGARHLGTPPHVGAARRVRRLHGEHGARADRGLMSGHPLTRL